MAHILVAGLINLETTLKVDAFPITYNPVQYPFFGVNTTVAGVGYNITRALTTLGDSVDLLSIIGKDAAADVVQNTLASHNIHATHVLPHIDRTAQSVILYDETGQRAIHTDLKDIQEQHYPLDLTDALLQQADLAVLCNINFSRPLLARAKALGIPIATDVHTIGQIDDDYNRDYMAAADILFQSHEQLPMTPDAWIRQIWEVYQTPVVVIGLGTDGALLGIRDSQTIAQVPAVQTRPVVNTVGAGDALFSAFVHTYAHTQDPHLALRKAVVFASYKIGMAGAAEGFLNAADLDEWLDRVN